MGTDQLILEAWWWLHLVENVWTLFYLSSRAGQYLLWPIPDYAVDIQIVQVYLWEALDHLRSLCPY